MEEGTTTSSSKRSVKPGSDIASLLNSIERSVHEAVELAVTAQQHRGVTKRKSSRGSKSNETPSRMSHDITSILRSSAEAVVGILNTRRLSDDDAESARDLLGHIKTLLLEVDSHNDNVYKLTDKAGKGKKGRSHSAVESESASDSESEVIQGAAARVVSKPLRTPLLSSHLPAPPLSTHPLSSESPADLSRAKGTSEEAKQPSPKTTGAAGIVAVSPPPRLRDGKGSRRVDTLVAPSVQPAIDYHAARTDRLESLLRRTEEVLERQLSLESAAVAEKSAQAASNAVLRAVDVSRSIPMSRSFLSSSNASGSFRQPFMIPSDPRTRSMSLTRQTPMAALSPAKEDAGLDRTLPRTGELSVEHLTSTPAPVDESGAQINALVAASDAVELARLRGELAVCRQRVSSAQADTDHARASRDEAERTLQDEKRVRMQAQAELNAAVQKMGSLNEQLTSAQDRLLSMQRALATAHADMEASAAAARQREQEAVEAARDELLAAVRAEKSAQEQLRSRALENARMEAEEAAQKARDLLQAEEHAHGLTRARLDEALAEIASLKAEVERLDFAVSESQNTLVRVRTDVVTLNARIAGANSSLTAKDDEVAALREQLRQLEDDVAQKDRDADDTRSALETQIADLGDMLAATEERAFAAEGRANEADALTEQLKQIIDRLRNDLDEARNDVQAASRDNSLVREEASKMAMELETKLATAEGKLLALNDQVESAQHTERVLRDTLAETQAALQVSTSRREAFEARIQELEQSLAMERASHSADVEDLRQQSDAAHEQVLQLHDTATSLQKELATVRDAHTSESTKLKETIKMLEKRVEEEKLAKDEMLRANRREIADAREHIQDLEAHLKDNEDELLMLREEQGKHAAEVTQLETARTLATERASKLVAEVENLKGRLSGERQAAEGVLGDADSEISRLTKALVRAAEDRAKVEVYCQELQQALELSEQRRQEEVDAAQHAATDEAHFAMGKFSEMEAREKAAHQRVSLLENTLATVKADLQTAADASRSDKKKCDALETRLKECEERLGRITRERDDAVRRASDSVAKVAADSSALVASLREELSSSKAELIRQTMHVETLQRQSREHELAMQSMQQRFNESVVEATKASRNSDSAAHDRDDLKRQLHSIAKERDALLAQIRALSADVARLTALNTSLASNSVSVESASKERQDALAHTLNAVEHAKLVANEAANRAEHERAAAETRAQQLEATVRQLAAELAFYRAKDEARSGLQEPRDIAKSSSALFQSVPTASRFSMARAVSPNRASMLLTGRTLANTADSTTADAPTAVTAVPPPTPAIGGKRDLSSPPSFRSQHSPSKPSSSASVASAASFKDQYLAKRTSPLPAAKVRPSIRSPSGGGLMRETVSSSLKRSSTALPSSLSSRE